MTVRDTSERLHMAVSLTNGSNLFNSSLWLVVWGDDRQVHTPLHPPDRLRKGWLAGVGGEFAFNFD